MMKKQNNLKAMIVGTSMGILTDVLGRKRVKKMQKISSQTMKDTKKTAHKIGEIAMDWEERLENRLK